MQEPAAVGRDSSIGRHSLADCSLLRMPVRIDAGHPAHLAGRLLRTMHSHSQHLLASFAVLPALPRLSLQLEHSHSQH